MPRSFLNNFALKPGFQFPVIMRSPCTSRTRLADVGVGEYHWAAVSTDGIVYTWGKNTNYQLGDDTTIARTSPIAISETGYDWKVATPTLSIASGTYNTNQTVVIANTTSGATIRYTQNGSELTESDTSIASPMAPATSSSR